MTTRSEPGRGRPGPSLSAIMGERRRLINLAYRLLGSLADAEDAVQETYARWYAMSAQQQEAIESPGRLADRTEWTTGRSGGGPVDPADQVTLDESSTWPSSSCSNR